MDICYSEFPQQFHLGAGLVGFCSKLKEHLSAGVEGLAVLLSTLLVNAEKLVSENDLKAGREILLLGVNKTGGEKHNSKKPKKTKKTKKPKTKKKKLK